MTEIKLHTEKLDAAYCLAKASCQDSGAVNIFIGTVRNETKGKKVVRLEFEAYKKMAVSEIEKIVKKVHEQWPVHNIVIHHRLGVLYPGDIPVIIAVSAAHRDTAFDACRFIIDTLKQTVPIWKKEIYTNGESWVAAHP